MKQTKDVILDKQYEETINRFIGNLKEHIDSRGDAPYEEVLTIHMASIFRMALIVAGYNLKPELRTDYIDWAEEYIESWFIEMCHELVDYDPDQTSVFDCNLN